MFKRGRPKNANSQNEYDLFREHFEDIVQNGELVSCTSTIFSELGRQLNKTPKAVYLKVKRDFREIFADCCSDLSDLQNEKSVINETTIDDAASEDETIENDVLSYKIQIEKDMIPLENYLKNARGKQIVVKRPIAGWADKLFELVWCAKKTNCAWVFRYSYVNADESILFVGDCTECKAVFRGIANINRTALDVQIKGYKEEYNHTKRRVVRGERKNQIAKNLENKSAFKVHRELAAELIEDGNAGLVPHLPSLGALRQIKYVSSIEDKQSAVQNILKWKNSSASFRNTIFGVGSSPFFVKYQLPIQKEWYLKECKNNDEKMAIALDSTGSLVIPPDDSEISSKTQKPKHIFLHNMMAKTDSTSIPIAQAISQDSTARFISNWIDEIFTDMPPPGEVVCDGSKALMLALVRALTPYRSVKEYIQANIKSVEVGCLPPNCFLRLDRSHFIQNLSKKIAYKNSEKRNFFRCVFGFLIQCNDFDEARHIIADLFTVILNKYTGTESGVPLPAGRSKRRLQNLCSTHIWEDTEVENNIDCSDNANEKSSVVDDVADDGWLQKIIERITVNNADYDDLVENAFYCEYDKQIYINILVNLPLWSNIMVNVYGSKYTTATSQDVESNFKTLKHHVFDQKMVRPDKFLLSHANYLKVEVKLRIAEMVTAKKKRSNKSNRFTQSIASPNYINDLFISLIFPFQKN